MDRARSRSRSGSRAIPECSHSAARIVPTPGEIRVGLRLDRGQPQAVQPGCLGRHERVVGDVRQDRSTPAPTARSNSRLAAPGSPSSRARGQPRVPAEPPLHSSARSRSADRSRVQRWASSRAGEPTGRSGSSSWRRWKTCVCRACTAVEGGSSPRTLGSRRREIRPGHREAAAWQEGPAAAVRRGEAADRC